jgi:hypothetical protein
MFVSMSVLMFETPGSLASSLRTEAAHPPHVMPGSFKLTSRAPVGGGASSDAGEDTGAVD